MFDFHGSHLDTDAVTPAGEEAIMAGKERRRRPGRPRHRRHGNTRRLQAPRPVRAAVGPADRRCQSALEREPV
jgi:hypothetical protein